MVLAAPWRLTCDFEGGFASQLAPRCDVVLDMASYAFLSGELSSPRSLPRGGGFWGLAAPQELTAK